MAQDTPKWLKNAVIYEVFTRNHSEKGTFEEVYKDLERIKELGADIVWFMPIHPIGVIDRKGTYGSPYAIKDYRAISPDLGDEKSFKKLIDKAHDLGMKVMIDVVYNHTSMDSVLVTEHPEWFIKDECGNISRKFDGWEDITDLDYSKRDLWDYLIETLRMWASLGVDGFRCDVASMVPLEFWKEARRVINSEKEVVWLAETVHKSFIAHLRGLGYVAHSDPDVHEAFDLTYDYDGFEYLQQYFKGEAEIKDYINHLYIQRTMFPEHAIKMRFLENHDNQRIATIITGQSALKNWTVFYNLLPGASLIYAGQEISAKKWPDLFEKDVINWDNDDNEFRDFLKNVVSITKEIKKNCTDFEIKELRKGLVKILWKGENDEYVSILNLEDRYGDIEVDFELSGKELLTGCCKEISTRYVIEKHPVVIKVK
ncbi:MAG: alpha-amylase family glycosyl hydrolase [Clostridia bacterium]|nr:alpha-amylase family glycosyl hydrolase [Clostridia bacterium]